MYLHLLCFLNIPALCPGQREPNPSFFAWFHRFHKAYNRSNSLCHRKIEYHKNSCEKSYNTQIKFFIRRFQIAFFGCRLGSAMVAVCRISGPLIFEPKKIRVYGSRWSLFKTGIFPLIASFIEINSSLYGPAKFDFPAVFGSFYGMGIPLRFSGRQAICFSWRKS